MCEEAIKVLENAIKKIESEKEKCLMPGFVKLPMHIAKEFEYHFKYDLKTELSNDTNITICGLKPCPTYTIKEIEEIEVF